MFNVAINAWATSGDPQAGTKAVELLNQMKQLASQGHDTAPDIVTYNSVLSAWSKSGHIHAGPQAERILKQLQEDKDSSVKPNVMSYNSVLHAWSKSAGLEPGAAERAQAILDYMIQSADDDIAPDVYSFTSVLNAWAKCKEDDKAIRARALLDTLLELQSKSPQQYKLSAIPFNAVLNACAFSSPVMQREALRIAVTTFKELPHYAKRDTISYGNLLKCCTNLMPQSQARVDMASQIFDTCCKEGLVGDLVWNEVRKVVPSRELARKLPSSNKKTNKPIGTMTLRDLPRSWKRNTRDKQAARRTRRRKPKHKQQDSDSSSLSPQPMRPMRNIVEKSYESGRDV